MNGARARVLAEVVLVFLGILAAFSLESWRDGRRDRARELALLADMVSEFAAAEQEAEELLEQHRQIRDALDELHRLFRTSEASLHPDSTLDLTIALWSVASFQPEMPSYEYLVASEGLALVRSDSLRAALGSFALVRARNRQYDDFWRDYDVQVLTPILSARLPIFSLIFGDGDRGGALRPDVRALASDLEFRNLMALRRNSEAVLADRRARLVDSIREVRRLLDREVS